MEKHNQIIKIYTSDTEKKKIINLANELQLSVSEYAKKVILNGPVFLNITTNDLIDYSWEIYQTNCKIQEILSILANTNTSDYLYFNDILSRLLNEINSNCKATINLSYKERKKIYRELLKQINKSSS